jgi:hypothetical protein
MVTRLLHAVSLLHACRTWYDLVWAFPRLSYKFSQRMIPTQAQLARTWGSSGGGAALGKDAAVLPGSEAVLPVSEGGGGDGGVAAAAGAAVGAASASSTAPAVEALQLVGVVFFPGLRQQQLCDAMVTVAVCWLALGSCPLWGCMRRQHGRLSLGTMSVFALTATQTRPQVCFDVAAAWSHVCCC